MRRSVAVYVLCSLLLSWPLITDPFAPLPTLQAGGFFAAWTANIVGLTGPALWTTHVNWPLGASLVGFSSPVFALLSGLLSPLLGAWGAVSLLALLSPVLNALAADYTARRLYQFSTPAALLTGLLYGFSGAVAGLYLHGEVALLLDPWTPLALLFLIEATRAGSARSYAAFFAFFMLSTMTAVEYGLNTLLLGLALVGVEDKRRAFGLLGVGALLLGGWAMAWPTPAPALSEHASLYTLLSWDEWSDADLSNTNARLSYVGLALLLVGLRRSSGRRLLLLGPLAAGALLALGPTLTWFGTGTELMGGAPGPFALLSATNLIHHPLLLMRLADLSLALLAGFVLQALPLSRLVWGLVALAGVDAVVGNGTLWRGQRHHLQAASAYQVGAPGSAILDLTPLFAANDPTGVAVLVEQRGCAQQIAHRRPILVNCLATAQAGPAIAVRSWLIERVLLDDLASVADTLGGLGVGAVVVHPDLFTPDVAALIRSRLETALGPPAAITMAGGEHLIAFAIPSVQAPVTVESAQAALRTLTGAP